MSIKIQQIEGATEAQMIEIQRDFEILMWMQRTGAMKNYGLHERILNHRLARFGKTIADLKY